MKSKLSILVLCLSFLFINMYVRGNSSLKKINKSDSGIVGETPVSIVYDIKVKTGKRKTGVEETYDGGTEALFISGKKARVRLVSLMRIQSIFFSFSDSLNHSFSIVKESGKRKYKYSLTGEQWNDYNNKYESDSCIFINDSLEILGYNCKKAIVMLKDNRFLTVYYTPLEKPVAAEIEPAFKDIPGLVLQYEYDYKKGSLTYTANKISHIPIDAAIFKVPGKGYTEKSYCSKCGHKRKK